MDLYVILRRSDGNRGGAPGGRGAVDRVGNDEMADEVRSIRSYVLNEDEGSVGTVCIYEAVSPEALRKHASLADLPADEIIPVADTVIDATIPRPILLQAGCPLMAGRRHPGSRPPVRAP